MPNGTYGGVRGKETEVGQKTFVSRPTRLALLHNQLGRTFEIVRQRFDKILIMGLAKARLKQCLLSKL